MNDPNLADLFRLDGKVAVVTGAGRGIGRGIARGMADMGATVVLASRSLDELDDSVAEIESRGGTASSMQLDVTDDDAITAAVNDTADTHGKLDIWVSNAGGSEHQGFFHVKEFPAWHWDEQFELNLRPHFIASRACMEVMEPGSSLVGISSIASLRPAVNFAAYGAAKAGMNHLATSMSIALGPLGIRSNVVSPGNVPTRATTTIGGTAPEDIPKMAKAIPLGRLGLPQDIATAVVFLVSDAGSWITGQNIVVSGGQ